MERNIGFCEESEKRKCKPLECKAICPIGEILRYEAENIRKCEKPCKWTRDGIETKSDINPCKDATCQVGATIIFIRDLKK